MLTTYAFCRITDDIVDKSNLSDDEKMKLLNEWEEEFKSGLRGKSKYGLMNNLGLIIKDFKLSIQPFLDLISGVRMDLTKKVYKTFSELEMYCFKVASTIGLMSIELFGYKNIRSKDYASNLGIAMQLTNIIRDVKEDFIRGRIYLPQDEMERFNYSKNDLANFTYNDNFVKLMEFQTKRSLYYYEEANKNFHPEDRKVLAMGRAMQIIYQRMLKKIIDVKYDVYKNQIKAKKIEKILISLGCHIKYGILNS